MLPSGNKIETLHLFPELTSGLIKLLRTLDRPSWDLPSPIPGRTIKDLVAHLIDGSLRRLSLQRDGYTDHRNNAAPGSYRELVTFIQELNHEWMKSARRLSPQILTDLLIYAEEQLLEYFRTLHPEGKAFFAVAWAGENESANWFDIAREYTEKWHHQMQIRMAAGAPLLMEPRFTKPLYDTFMLGLPHLLRDADFPQGSAIEVIIGGRLGKNWIIQKTENWQFIHHRPTAIVSSVEIPDDVAWMIFTNTDRDKEKYFDRFKISGDPLPARKLLHYVTVMS